jgi:hypothetical protein
MDTETDHHGMEQKQLSNLCFPNLLSLTILTVDYIFEEMSCYVGLNGLELTI